jgi:pyruvate dehydrogenase (quinone)
MVFGLPGDKNAWILNALRRRQDKIRFVLVRHEEGAAFMASGYAKFTGKLGVCVSTAGPGAVSAEISRRWPAGSLLLSRRS